MPESSVPEDSPPEAAPYGAILTSIVKRFVRLIGAPAALSVARRVPQLTVDEAGNVLSYDQDNPLGAVMALVDQYEAVFGNIAVTLAHQAAGPAAATNDDSRLSETGLLASTTVPTMKILLVDDHALFREGLVSLLDRQPDLQIVGQAGSVGEAIAMAQAQRPDLVLMDFSLPDGTGLEATEAILAERPGTWIVFLTVHEDDARLFAAIRAGAMGYLLKNVRATELLKMVRGVARGEAGISGEVARRILEEFAQLPSSPQAEPEPVSELTARELEIVRELARGATNREIAQRFVISENTVKNHVRNVLAKLHLRSRRDVASYLRAHGLYPPSVNSSV